MLLICRMFYGSIVFVPRTLYMKGSDSKIYDRSTIDMPRIRKISDDKGCAAFLVLALLIEPRIFQRGQFEFLDNAYCYQRQNTHSLIALRTDVTENDHDTFLSLDRRGFTLPRLANFRSRISLALHCHGLRIRRDRASRFRTRGAILLEGPRHARFQKLQLKKIFHKGLTLLSRFRSNQSQGEESITCSRENT